jgi:hypothetical protein
MALQAMQKGEVCSVEGGPCKRIVDPNAEACATFNSELGDAGLQVRLLATNGSNVRLSGRIYSGYGTDEVRD